MTAMAATKTMAIDVTGIESSHNYANSANQTWTLSCLGQTALP